LLNNNILHDDYLLRAVIFLKKIKLRIPSVDSV